MKLSTPVYILGLERKFRGENLVKSLEPHFENVQVFFGFDAYSSSQSKIDNLLDMKLTKFLMHRKLSRGEAGCAISHKLIYKDITLSQVQSALILEDDCLISNMPKMLTIVQECNRIIEENPESPIALQIGSLHSIYSDDDSQIWLEKMKFPSYGTFGYLLSKSAAVLLSETNSRVSATADWPILALELEWYKPSQSIIQVQLGTSTILQDRSEIFFIENTQVFLKYLRKTSRYLSTIFGIRIVIAARHKIPAKLIWKWDIEFKYWRKKLEKEIRERN